MQNARILSSIAAAILLIAFAVAAGAESQPSLVERLGFPPNTKVLIINGDDFGMNHTTNVATLRALKMGGLTSTTVMAPCPWFLEAADLAKKNPQISVGVHTTLTSEWGHYKWEPVVGWKAAPSLCDERGYLLGEVPQVYLSAKLEDVEKEVRAQVDRALAAGIDVTHIDSHMGTMQYAPGYHELYIKIAKSYNLPCRIAGHDLMDKAAGGYLIEMADKLGVLHPEALYMGDPKTLEDTENYRKQQLADVAPGKVTELYIHCAEMTPEMESTTGSAKRRTADTEFFCDPKTREYIKSLGIELISYRELRYLQREGKPMPRVAGFGWE
jgi:hypothetical protein